MPSPDSYSISALAARLIETIGTHQHVAVAFSGGVDSSVVAIAAHVAQQSGLLNSAVAVTAVSPSVASWQLDIAHQVAAQIGISHRTIKTTEIEKAAYRQNDHRRCFHCKATLYQSMRASIAAIAMMSPEKTLISGTNADDAGDYRPGMEAGRLANVQTPLLDLGIDKKRVRQLASHFGLANAELPASPCLASRIAYGTEVTTKRLERIDQAESWLRHHGFEIVRVRTEQIEVGSEFSKILMDHARIEVDPASVDRLQELNRDQTVDLQMRELGFGSMEIDPRGFRSGNLNRVFDVVPLLPPAEGLPHE